MNTNLINKINYKDLSVAFVLKHINDIEDIVFHVSNQSNLLFILACLINEGEERLADIVADRLSVIFDYSYHYHNYDLVFIYCKKYNIDLGLLYSVSRYQNVMLYNIYFNTHETKNNLNFDLNKLNLSFVDCLDYFSHRGTTSSSMISEHSNSECILNLVNMNEIAFEDLMNYNFYNSRFFPENVLDIEYNKGLKIFLKNTIEENLFNPFTNRLSVEENLIFINKVFEKSFSINHFLVFYTLSSIDTFSDLDTYPFIKNKIFDTFALEARDFDQNKFYLKMAEENSLTLNTHGLKFRNIILIKNFINDKFKIDFCNYIKNIKVIERKQKVFLSLEYLEIDNVLIEDFFDVEFLGKYLFEIRYGSNAYGNNTAYQEVRFSNYFKNLFCEYVLRKNDVGSILTFNEELGVDTLKKMILQNNDFKEKFKGRFFTNVFDMDIFTSQEYNEFLLKNLFKDCEYGYDNDIDMLEHCQDYEGLLAKLNPADKSLVLYLRKDKSLIAHFDTHKDLLLENKSFIELLAGMQFKSFLIDYINFKESASIISEINDKAISFEIDCSELLENFSTSLITNIDDIF